MTELKNRIELTMEHRDLILRYAQRTGDGLVRKHIAHLKSSGLAPPNLALSGLAVAGQVTI